MLALVLAATIATTPEVERIQRHFDGAIAQLTSREVSDLSATQRANRSALIRELARYRDRGLFPRNYDFPGEAVPYFVDRVTGVRCAVAHLLEFTGRADIVARVAALDNNIWVPDLGQDGPFLAWLDEQGLTLAEAARIQVPYVEAPPPSPLVQAGLHRPSSQAFALGATVGTAVLARYAAEGGPQRLIGLVGLTAGAVSIAASMGAAQNEDMGALAISNLVAGGVGMYLGWRAFGRGVVAHRAARRAQVTPMIPLSSQSGAGLSVSIAF